MLLVRRTLRTRQQPIHPRFPGETVFLSCIPTGASQTCMRL